MPAIKLGLPYRGYYSAGGNDEVGPDYLTTDSTDWRVSPHRGRLVRRAGSLILGDTLSGGHEVAGFLTNSKTGAWGAKTRHLVALRSPSDTANFPTFCGLWGLATQGQVAFRDFNTNEWHTLGDRFLTDYPINGGTGTFLFKMLPTYGDGDARFSRCLPGQVIHGSTPSALANLTGQQQIQFAAGGQRLFVSSYNRVLIPSEYGTPCVWDGGFNDSSAPTNNNQRITPLGSPPPLWMADQTNGDVSFGGGGAASNDLTWSKGQSFSLAIAFVREDGSYSPPYTPLRGVVPAVVTIPATFAAYKSMTLNNLPIGPYDTKWRAILTSKQSATAVGVSPYDFQILGFVYDNTSTSATFYDGSGLFTIADPINLRTSWKMPSRGRFVFDFDGHVVIGGKLRPNPLAAWITMRAAPGGTLYNHPDTDSLAGLLSGCVGVRYDDTAAKRFLIARCFNNNHVEPSAPLSMDPVDGGGNVNTIVNMLGLMNASASATTTATYGDFKGQPAAGVQQGVTCDKIEITQVKASCTMTNGSANVAVLGGSHADTIGIQVGMTVVVIGGGGFSDVTCVASVAAGTANFTTSRNFNLANGTYTLLIGWECGDLDYTNWYTVGYNGLTYPGCAPGEFRCFGNALPVPLYFSQSYLAQFQPRDQEVEMSCGDAGHAAYAIHNWDAVACKREMPAGINAGRFVGGAGIRDAAIVYFSSGAGLISNIKNVKTGLDADLRLQPIYSAGGSICPFSIVGLNGAAGALTERGYEVTDGNRTVLISDKIYDSGERRGAWSYEIGQCRIDTARDDDTIFSDQPSFNATVVDQVLIVTYRSSGSATWCDRMQYYDFSQAKELYGVSQMLDRNGEPWPWSTPMKLRGGQVVKIVRSDGRHLYMAIDSNAGTNPGRVDEFETGYQDNGAAIAPVGYHGYIEDQEGKVTRADAFIYSETGIKAQFMNALLPIAPRQWKGKHTKNGAGLSLGMYREIDRATLDSLALPSSGAASYLRFAKVLPDAMGRIKTATECVISDDGTVNTPVEFRGGYLLVDPQEETFQQY